MKNLLKYLNPLSRLGIKRYSLFFPLLFSAIVPILSELFVYGVLKNPNAVGAYIIFVNVATIIYFSFRDGIKGALASSLIPIVYYFYIIETRNYTGQQYISAVETTLVLAALYLILGGVIGWLKQTIDNLIEKEANGRKRLEAIIEQLPVGVIITDSKARVTNTNRQLEKILGVSIPKGFLLGTDEPLLTGKYKDSDIHPSQSPIAHAIATRKSVNGKEFVVQRKDGKTVYLQVNSSPIFDRSGKIAAATSIVTDITARREIESRKDEFINMASHELKTPITSMKLYLESVISRVAKYKDPSLVKSLTSIQYQTDKLQELAADLLDVSRIQTGKLSFTKEKFRLTDVVAETIYELQATSKKHKLVLSKKAVVNVYADKFRISQVLTNLLTNAIKYSPQGGEIEVKVLRRDNKAFVSVSDEGIGVEDGEREKIFDRLYQVSDPKVKTFPGLGLGLYISKEIIKRHNGKIWVEANKKKGSVFCFEIPLEGSR
jgi:PAS domain S-box-containing protein